MRAPNLGTYCVSLHACAQSRLQMPPAVLAAPTPLKAILSPMSTPRHLAPTVGQETAAAVIFCTGSRGRLGQRVATGLVTTFGSIDFVADGGMVPRYTKVHDSTRSSSWLATSGWPSYWLAKSAWPAGYREDLSGYPTP